MAKRKYLFMSFAVVALLLALFFFIQKNNKQQLRLFDVIDCNIFSTTGELFRKLTPGGMCVFFPDGSLVLFNTTDDTVKMFSASNQLMWERNFHAHHQVKASPDFKEILFLGSEILNRHGKRVHYPIFYALDLSGNIVKQFRSSEHESEIEALATSKGLISLKDPGEKLGWKNTEWEYSHINSIYEIPENPNSLKSEAFQKGNYIVSFYRKGFFAILDSSMKKILWHKNFESLHDVQVLPSGNILLYENRSPIDGNSRLLILDPFSDKVIWSYQANPPEKFHSIDRGGVQLLSDGTFLFNDRTDGGYAIQINAVGKELMRYTTHDIDLKTRRPRYFQEVKRLDLYDFLKNSQL